MRTAVCHPSRKMQARDMCKSCYDKWLKETNSEYKERQISNTTAWARKNPEKMKAIQSRRKIREALTPELTKAKKRESFIKRTYGITQEIYNKMLKEQSGVCAMCFKSPADGKVLHIDHCHTSGKVRGLLCHQCNWFLGLVDHDIEIIKRMENYVKGEE